MQELDFLHRVWSKVCEPGDYVFLSIRTPKWKDFYFKFDSSLKGRIRDWLRQHSPKEMDVYFCPLPFSQPERLAKYVKPVNMLWSDIDDGDPTKVRPSVLWESSPGHHHALWFLKEKLHAEDAAELNRSLTYYMGADKGGWDLSQVLRIPGTYNHKYKSKPQVKLLHWDNGLLNHRVIAKRVRHKIVPQVKSTNLLSKYRLPSKVVNLLQSEAEPGRRSDVIWYLENKLSEAGIPPDDIIQIIKESDWNKYKGRHDEDHRLKTELSKVIESRPPKPKPLVPREGLNIQEFSEVMSSLETTPGWQVKGFWMKRSHGIVAGEPKSFKSTLVMDMALSIASGAPFLGRYPVEEQGKVLYIQNENAHWIIKDRFEKMVKAKGLGGKVVRSKNKLKVHWPKDIPLCMINQQNFMLTDPEQQEFLEETIAEMKPVLVVLDPLYLMFDGDVSSAQELFPVLQWLLYLKNTYKCGILVIHHYNKSGEGKRGGQRMLGSTTLHGWIESAWYISTVQNQLAVNREFRGAGLHEQLEIEIQMGDTGDPHYSAEVVDAHQISPAVSQDILAVVKMHRGTTMENIALNTGYTMKQIQDALSLMDETIYIKAHRVYARKPC